MTWSPSRDLPYITKPWKTEAVFKLLAVAILAASIVWRLGNLNAFSLSNDEGAYLMWAWLVNSGHPLYSETVSVSAPLFIAALDWAFWLGGVSLITGRVLGLAFFGLTLLSLVWAGKLLHGWSAGLIAATVFSLAPLAFLLSRMAVGEIPSIAMASLSVASALAYLHRGGKGWLALSGLALSVSILIKAMNPLVAVPVLWLIAARNWRRQERWTEIMRAVAVWAAAGLLPVLACLLVYDAEALYDQAITFRFDLREAFPWLLTNNLGQLLQFLGQHWGATGLALAGSVLLTYKLHWGALLTLGLWLGGNLASALVHSPLFLHHTVILLPPLALLAGIGFAETVIIVQERRWMWGAFGLVGILGFVLSVPTTLQANQTTREASFGREAEAAGFLRQVTYPADNVISDNLLLPFMAGRQTPPPLGDVAQVAIDSGRQTSRRLIAISEVYPVEAVANWALRLPYLDQYMDWVDKNYLVRRVWDDHHVIYFGRRVPVSQIRHRIDAQVGSSIELLGYDVQSGEQAADIKLNNMPAQSQVLYVTLYWQRSGRLIENYTVFVHLLDSEGELVAQHDGQPLYGYLPTADWPPNEVIKDRHRLLLPVNLPADAYQLIAGMYRLETLERLPVRVAHSQATDESVILTRLEIEN